jgi:hypothetical protein
MSLELLIHRTSIKWIQDLINSWTTHCHFPFYCCRYFSTVFTAGSTGHLLVVQKLIDKKLRNLGRHGDDTDFFFKVIPSNSFNLLWIYLWSSFTNRNVSKEIEAGGIEIETQILS